MTQADVIKYWREGARDALETANDLLITKKYHYALFFWQLALEKLLKGILVRQDIIPPPSHDLFKLTKLAKLSFDIEKEIQLNEITTFNIEARYDDYKHSFYKKATRDYTGKWVKHSQELYQWLLKQY